RWSRLSEEHFWRRERANESSADAQQQGAVVVYAFEHATRLLMRQPCANTAAQPCGAREPGIADRGKALAAPDLIPFGVVGREMKERVVPLGRRYAKCRKRGRGKF